MLHYKSESGGKLPKALCRFVKILPTGKHEACGSGCIVLQSGPPPSADLITTTQVLTKIDLQGDSLISVQFEDNQQFKLKLKRQDAVNLPDSKPGRVLGDIEGNKDQVSFLRIPADMFDSRKWLLRKISPMTKRALSCFYPSDENLETSISNKKITCYVISEDRKNRGLYITASSYLRFDTDTHEFSLLSVSDTDCASPANIFKDVAKEEKLEGAPLLDAEGRLVGMLAVANSGERKVYPVFLPTLTADSNTDGPNTPFPKTVTDPIPFEQKLTLQEIHSNSQHGMDRTATMQTGEVSTEKKHVNAGSYVEEFILRKELIMDLLSLYLDRSIYPSLAQNWEHLADYCKVDAKIKMQCKHSARLSPSEAMFQHLCQSWESVTVRTLKQNLLEVSRKDVYDELANNQDLLDDDSMNDLCNKHPETLCNICLHLDDNRSVSYWYHLGLKIGISGDVLRSFKDPSGSSPSKAILEKIETLNPELSLEDVQTVLLQVEKWLPDIRNVLKNLAADSRSTIQTLLDDLDAVEKLTTLLDLEEKAWVLFGSKLGMERLQLNNLREESPPSPTKLLMKHIVAREPNLTMKFFLGALANIKRFDVIKELKKFFVAKDIDDLLKG